MGRRAVKMWVDKKDRLWISFLYDQLNHNFAYPYITQISEDEFCQKLKTYLDKKGDGFSTLLKKALEKF